MKNYFIRTFSITIALAMSLIACQKDWLDAKPDEKLVIPTTLADFQAMLDNSRVFNQEAPYLIDLGSDDYFVTASYYASRIPRDQNIYSWAAGNVFDANRVPDWEEPYKQIFHSNSILEGVAKIETTPFNLNEWNNVRGSALFFRAWAYFNLAQLFCKPYTASTAASDLGVVLRIESNVNAPSERASVQETYDLIISDLMRAKDVLTTSPLYKTRPSKQAACALLARTYLSMESYDSAFKYSNESLLVYSTLANYNNSSIANPTASNPFSFSTNPEIMFISRQGGLGLQPSASGHVDSTLFQMYAANDKRRTLFFKTMTDGRRAFIGSYYGATYLFHGLATDEMYLTRAECYARKNQVAQALSDLNALYQTRWGTGTGAPPFQPYTATTGNDALKLVLAERRKQLCFRGTRWTDLRRLNKDPQFAKTVVHGLLGSATQFTLPPNDNRYVWPIPDSEILYSGIQQNPR